MRNTILCLWMLAAALAVPMRQASAQGSPQYLALDAQILKLPEPTDPSKVFDFTLQREVNRELGIR